MNQELKQILERLFVRPYPDYNMGLLPDEEGYDAVQEYENYHAEEQIDQAHSAIIETIKKALPEDMDTDGSYGKYPSGWNDCLEQIKSNLGVDDE